MYLRASTLFFPVYALASLAAAAPGGIDARGGSSSCTSGTELCCATTYPADSTGVAAILALLNFVVDPVIGPLLAVDCAAFVGSCNAQTVCCESSQDNNLVYVGCNNIAL
ncbi:fungal hydrophobin [Pisolithus croceorrhizus]|nr:fungal hydrophobin [Pisolithus croceorrhizus]KAI6162820.1 fungal hydrophobin [Pisolithus thermaeus]